MRVLQAMGTGQNCNSEPVWLRKKFGLLQNKAFSMCGDTTRSLNCKLLGAPSGVIY